MKRYLVTIPITGFTSIEVEANDETEAEYKAWHDDKLGENLEWEFVSQVTRGNVFYGMQNDTEVEELP